MEKGDLSFKNFVSMFVNVPQISTYFYQWRDN